MSNQAGSLDFSKPWELSDVLLVVEEERFHVHRCILGMWSEVCALEVRDSFLVISSVFSNVFKLTSHVC